MGLAAPECGPGSGASSLRATVATAPRGVDLDDVARLHGDGKAAFQLLYRARRRFHGREEFEAPAGRLAAGMLARAAGALPHLERLQAHWKPPLEDLRVGE